MTSSLAKKTALALLALAAVAAFFSIPLHKMTRIRILMAAVSAVVFVITILSIRSYKLREKYAILWLSTAGMIVLVALFPQIVEKTRLWFGMQYVTSIVAIIFVFLVLVVFHFSIALSALNDKAAATAVQCAILGARLDALERRLSSDGVPRK